MARRWISGFDVRENYHEGNDGGGGGGQTSTASARIGKRGHGAGCSYRRRATSTVSRAHPAGAAATNVLSERFYFRVLRVPTTGASIVYACRGTLEGGESVRMRLTTAGTVTWENQGNAGSPVVFYTWASPVLGAWNLIQTRWAWDTDPTAASNGNARIRINGVEVYNGGVGAAGTGLNLVQNSGNATLGPGTTVDAEWDIDDWSADNSEWPIPPGTIRRIIPTGPGFYNEWTLSDWRAAVGGQSLGFAGGSGITNNAVTNPNTATNGARVSFAVDLAQLRNMGTVKAIHIFAMFSALGHTVDLLLRVNGVDTYVRSGIATNASLVTANSQVVNGAMFAAGDAVEIGVRKASGAGTLRLLSISMNVEHDGEDSTAQDEVDGDVQVGSGTFTGSTTAIQAINIGFQPDFFIAWSQASFNNGAIVADTFLDRFLSDARNLGSQIVGNNTITGIHNGVAFVVPQGALGQAATPYFWLAIKDHRRRALHRESFALDAASAYDNTNLALDRGDFTPELVWVAPMSTASSTSAHLRDPAHVGDLTTQIGGGAAPVADVVQALGTGIIQIGTVLTAGGFPQRDFISFRTNGFNTVRLWDIVTWTGNGAASRTILFPNISGTPAVVFALPHNTRPLGMRATGATVTTQFSGSQTTNGFSLVAGGITVGGTSGGDYNANGVLYSAIGFIIGIDPGEVPEAEFPPDDNLGGKMVPLVWVEGLLET